MTKHYREDEEDEEEEDPSVQASKRQRFEQESREMATTLLQHFAPQQEYVHIADIIHPPLASLDVGENVVSLPAITELKQHFSKPTLTKPEFVSAFRSYHENALRTKTPQQFAQETEKIFNFTFPSHSSIPASSHSSIPASSHSSIPTTSHTLYATLTPLHSSTPKTPVVTKFVSELPPLQEIPPVLDEPCEPVESPLASPAVVYSTQKDAELASSLWLMALGVACGLVLPLFRTYSPYLAQHLGYEASNPLAWAEFVCVHWAFLAIAVFVIGMGKTVNLLLAPHRHGVIAEAVMILIGVYIANVTLTDFESRTMMSRSKFYWIVPEIKTKAGALTLVLCGLSLEVLTRNISGLMQHFLGTGLIYYGGILAICTGLYEFGSTHSSSIMQGYSFALLGLMGLRSILRFVCLSHLVIFLVLVSVMLFTPTIAQFAPAGLVEEAKHAWLDFQRVSGMRL